jgi:hypothetical protein
MASFHALESGKKPPPLLDAAQKPARRKITIRDPKLPRLNSVEHPSEQPALLGMPVLTGENVSDEPSLWVQHCQSLPRKRGGSLVAKLSNATFGRLDATAVEDLRPVAFQPRAVLAFPALASERASDRGELLSAVSNQFGGDPWLKGAQFVVDRRFSLS